VGEDKDVALVNHGVGHHQPHEAARATAADRPELVEALKEAYLKGFGRLLRSAGHFRP
jgi:hypothetical protein